MNGSQLSKQVVAPITTAIPDFCLFYGANQHSPSTWYAANELAMVLPLCYLA